MTTKINQFFGVYSLIHQDRVTSTKQRFGSYFFYFGYRINTSIFWINELLIKRFTKAPFVWKLCWVAVLLSLNKTETPCERERCMYQKKKLMTKKISSCIFADVPKKTFQEDRSLLMLYMYSPKTSIFIVELSKMEKRQNGWLQLRGNKTAFSLRRIFC